MAVCKIPWSLTLVSRRRKGKGGLSIWFHGPPKRDASPPLTSQAVSQAHTVLSYRESGKCQVVCPLRWVVGHSVSFVNWMAWNNLGDKSQGVPVGFVLSALTEVGGAPTGGGAVCTWSKGVEQSQLSASCPRVPCDHLLQVLRPQLTHRGLDLNSGPKQTLSPLSCFSEDILPQQQEGD